MDSGKIQELASVLPEHIILEAAKKYIIELGREGNFRQAEKFYNLFKECGCDELASAEILRDLLNCHIARHDIDKAISLYSQFPHCENGCGVITEKILACHAIVHALLPNKLLSAFELWREFTKISLNSCQKWHWAQCGLALLEQCHKNSCPELARAIHATLNAHASCKLARTFLDKANRLMLKTYSDNC